MVPVGSEIKESRRRALDDEKVQIQRAALPWALRGPLATHTSKTWGTQTEGNKGPLRK